MNNRGVWMNKRGRFHRTWIGAALLILVASTTVSSSAAPASVDQQMPDLTVTDVYADPFSSTAGEGVTLFATVHNRGSADAPSSSLSFRAIAEANDGLWWTSTPPIRPSSSVTVSYQALYPGHGYGSGNYSLEATADAFSEVSESNEDNNLGTGSFIIRPFAPDLRVAEIKVFPESPASGDLIEFTLIITNEGTVDAPPSKASLYELDHGVWLVDVPGVPHDQTVGVTSQLPDGAKPGARFLLVGLDYYNEVAEFNEENNRARRDYFVRGPDLVVTSVSVTPNRPTFNKDQVSYSASITNVGLFAAPSSTASFSGGGVWDALVSTPALEPGESTLVSWDGNGYFRPSPPGDNEVVVIADFLNDVAEELEDNNSAAKTFTVVPCPDNPTNDARANACFMSMYWWSFTHSQSTSGFSVDVGEIPACTTGLATAWYIFNGEEMPSATATLTLDTFGSSFDTVIAIYKPGGIFPIACSDNSMGTEQSQISLAVGSGEQYWIQVGGVLGATGTLVVNAELT